MREIKFRAWKKPTKDEYMEYEDEMFYSGQEEFKRGASLVHIDDDDALMPNEYEWMQYTGLKDKNGKEIYEGDILSLPNYAFTPANGENPCLLAEVRFEEGRYVVLSKSLTDYEMQEVEVIGNIYENKELLNDN